MTALRRNTWTRRSEERLLETPIRDLGLRIEGTVLDARIERLYDELGRQGLRFLPRCWLSSEWFSPDGVPGIAIPFYLGHPRLARLEQKQMLEVEGGNRASCMRLLRHEAGHAIDTAFRLHFKAEWRATFGRYSEPYPRYYRPRANSRRFVLHLDGWYAQAHPAEDFAETFAVWLAPRSDWRKRYREWPVALRKLKYVDRIMKEIAGQPPRVASRRRIEPVERLTETLGEHYRRKRKRYATEGTTNYDRDLRRIFSEDPRHAAGPRASKFLRELRSELRETVSEWTGVHAYTIDQVLREVIERCRELKLRLASSPARATTQVHLLLTVHTMSLIRSRRHEIPV